jgi:hypothetical protein
MDTPRRIRKAFAGAVKGCGLVVHPPTAAHWMVLEDIESPLVVGRGAIRMTHYAAAALLLSLPAVEAERLAADPSALEEAAKDLCRAHPLADVRAMGSATMALLTAALGLDAPPPGNAEPQLGSSTPPDSRPPSPVPRSPETPPPGEDPPDPARPRT